MQFATNHLGHFALALGLHDALADAGDARIVSLSSRGHLRSPVVFDDLHFALRPYDPWLAYGQSKTANVLFAVEATRRWAGDGITANARPPGRDRAPTCPATWTPRPSAALRTSGMYRFKTGEQGAATSRPRRHLAAARGHRRPLLRGLQRGAVVDAPVTASPAPASRAYALDPENAERLWDVSEELLA